MRMPFLATMPTPMMAPRKAMMGRWYPKHSLLRSGTEHYVSKRVGVCSPSCAKHFDNGDDPTSWLGSGGRHRYEPIKTSGRPTAGRDTQERISVLLRRAAKPVRVRRCRHHSDLGTESRPAGV